MKVLLICQAGMSTAIMCKKIEESARKDGEEIEISAAGLDAAAAESAGKDIILLAPQVKYAAKEVRNDVPHHIPIMIIPSQDFGLMNGSEVYRKMNQVLKGRNE